MRRPERLWPGFVSSPPLALLGVAVPAFELDGMGEKAVVRGVAILTGRFLGVGSLRACVEESAEPRARERRGRTRTTH